MTNLDDQYAIDDRILAFENHKTGLLISRAGPGTGKTYSFLRRISALITDHNIQPEEICYLTFIKDISKAFLTDYEEKFPANLNVVNRSRVSTLHSFACRIIRNKGFSKGYDGPLYFASIADLDSPASLVFLDDLLPIVRGSGLKSRSQLCTLLHPVKQAWRNNTDPKSLPKSALTITDVALQLSRAYRLIDWDQAIPLAHELFLNPENRDRWLTQLQHFLVDEYQDFNIAEQLFITTIASTVVSMVIVGDDNQSIFSSRGGSPDGMRNLFQSPIYDQVSLLKCHRCKTNILSAANRYLHWMSPTAQQMHPHNVGGSVSCNRFKSSKAEIDFLIDYLNTKVAELPASPLSKEGVICLFPTKKALSFYYEKIQPHTPSYTGRPEPHPTRKKLALMLELVCHPNQRFIERLILELFTAIKPRHKLEMVRLILQHDISPSDAMERLISSDVLSGAAVVEGQGFVELCHHLSSQDPKPIANALSSHFGHMPEEFEFLINDLLIQLGKTDQDDLINTFCDRALPEFATPLEDRKTVLFLTMHGSKGLTKKTVVLPGLENAWLPGDSTGADLEEKKRLFYVAITRATDNLLITYPYIRGRGDPLNYNTPGRGEVSQFVRHAGIRDVYHR